MTPATIEDYVRQHAADYGGKLAIISAEDRCSYGELQRRMDQRAQELRDEGWHEGQVVCLRAASTIDFIVTYFAVHTIGCVAAPFERDFPEEAFDRMQRQLRDVTVARGTADILFTTGTTGKAKGVVISHRAIMANAENLIDGQGFSHELAFVINGPLNHIGSLSKVYPTIIMGGTIVLVDGLRQLDAFYHAFSLPFGELGLPPTTRYATFLVPASIRILLQLSADRLAGIASTIDFIETGAAAMPYSDMLELCRLMPYCRLYNTYASTETGIISTYNFNDGITIPRCLGKPMRHSKIIITDSGHIACQGPTLMTDYVFPLGWDGGEKSLPQGKTEEGLFITADMGTLDEEGRLLLTGRDDDVINVGGLKVAPSEVEDAAMSHPSVSDCICIAVSHKITGWALKLLVVARPPGSLNKRELARYLNRRLESYKVPLLYEEVGMIRRTFNGKLDRKAYRCGM